MESFQKGLCLRKKLSMVKQDSKIPILQEIKAHIELGDGYADLFPEKFKLFNILLALPLETASV